MQMRGAIKRSIGVVLVLTLGALSMRHVAVAMDSKDELSYPGEITKGEDIVATDFGVDLETMTYEDYLQMDKKMDEMQREITQKYMEQKSIAGAEVTSDIQ